MIKTITANFPARTIKLSGGKTRTFPALIEIFELDSEGRYTRLSQEFGNERERYGEDAVIEICRRASNWAELRAKFFPMVGFHN